MAPESPAVELDVLVVYHPNDKEILNEKEIEKIMNEAREKLRDNKKFPVAINYHLWQAINGHEPDLPQEEVIAKIQSTIAPEIAMRINSRDSMVLLTSAAKNNTIWRNANGLNIFTLYRIDCMQIIAMIRGYLPHSIVN